MGAIGKTRLEAFSDGVIAIIITIMVLELKVPHGEDAHALLPMIPIFLGYIFSFIMVGIYWNNHHHLFHMVHRINGSVLWANLHLLFWLSLIPVTTGWMQESHFSPLAVALYGVVLFMAGIAWPIMMNILIKIHGFDSPLAIAMGKDRKGKISVILYAVAIPLAFVSRWIAIGLYIAVAVIWFIPDQRVEKNLPHD
ncbi:TMEM175 family protein [Iodobacter sp. CM08]|uniref:TMEM175 family protein n=1 Tax=Iodobacter sp. CM08 TaxID=3085902 RepID=UPI0029824512|nr:TMEM175 family protein [Iodobacter sp. CM08]MDW5415157.1 TMEM175 family protein [Iodobacter sp. CM08]